MLREMIPLFIAFWAAFLAGCTATTVNELDRDLIDTYVVKVRITETEGPFGGSDAVYDRFIDISKRAEKAAKELGDENRLNKIALLRIAATAAWQANDRPVSVEHQSDSDEISSWAERNESVLRFAIAGKKLCGEMEAIEAPPRDCVYFGVVTTLNTQTRNARELQAYLRRKAELSSDERLQLTGSYLVAAVAAFKKTSEYRESLLGSAVPQAYYRWLDKQRFFAFCDASKSAVEYNEVYADMPDNEPRTLTCDQDVARLTSTPVKAMRKSLEQSYDSVRCANLSQSYNTWKFDSLEDSSDVVVPAIPVGNICKP